MDTENTARSGATTQDGESSAAREAGTVAEWHADRGYGFIRPLITHRGGPGRMVFVHARQVQRRPRELRIGEQVTFTRSSDPAGRPCAVNVELAEGVQRS